MATSSSTISGIFTDSIGSSDAYNLQRILVKVIREYNDNFGKIHASFATAIALSGLTFIFLSIAFAFPRSAARRTSLYLICLASLFCCLDCIIRMYTYPYDLAGCVTRGFFADYFEYSALYLTAAIAVNLHLQFHRKSTDLLPGYTTWLLIGVPLLVAALHQVPQYAYSGAIGTCTYVLKYTSGTTSYVIRGVFAVIFIPGVVIVYSAVISIWTIVKLSRRKAAIGKTISSILHSVEQNQDKSSMLKEVSRLQAVRSVYSGAIRIAIYPLGPLIWLALRCAELGLSNTVPRVIYDAQKVLNGMYISALVVPVFVLVSFLLFLFDPVFGQLFSKSQESETERIERIVAGAANPETKATNASQISDSIIPETRSNDIDNFSDNEPGDYAADPVAVQVSSSQDARRFFKSL
ncbi:hypothetical protein FB645_000965 [Coemansia sp. IMI 203386]|nr:hypothetical protein FB645_000965 [Coemansia sp. IMI 203386]